MTPKKQAVVFNLQLFAGEAAAAGDNNTATPAADTGDNSSTVPPVTDTQTGNTPGTEVQNENNSSSPRLSFEELLKNEETAKEANAFVKKQFGKRFNERIKSQETEISKMREILGFTNLRYNLDPDSETYLDDLNAKVQNDAKLFEDEALAAGMDRDAYLKVKQAEQIIAQNKRNTAEREQQELINNHILNLRQQEASLKEKYPGFDLETELQNRAFRSLVDPPALGGSGLPVENAYYALHYKEIQKNVASQAVNQATTAVANAVATNKSRPTENVNIKKASTVPVKSFKNMTKEDFDKIRAEFLRSGKAPF
ncbi:MAG: hypothetical protein IJ725_02885 [Ruminococcus sp.]|nr:hypothetical protein [Ruminococcus sp.]